MASSTIVPGRRGQVVRLPEAVAFPNDVREVDILKLGRSRLIVPRGQRWGDLFVRGPRASEDFMNSR